MKTGNIDKAYKYAKYLNCNMVLFNILWLSKGADGEKDEGKYLIARRAVYILIPFAILSLFAVALIYRGVFDDNVVKIQLYDDFANCYAMPYVFVFSYFAQGYYNSKQRRTLNEITERIKDAKQRETFKQNIKELYKKYIVYSCIGVIIVSLFFAFFFIHLARTNDANSQIAEWSMLLMWYDRLLYDFLVFSLWIMSAFLIVDSVYMSDVFMRLSRHDINSSVEHYDRMLGFRACINGFISRLSLLLYYIFGIAICVVTDISLRNRYGAEHFFATENMPYFLIFIFIIMVAYCGVNIIPIFQYRKIVKNKIDDASKKTINNKKISSIDNRLV